MSIGDIFYIIAIVLFSIMTFAIIRGNFQRKFDENGHRHDLKKKEIKKDK
jgi:uncharacterized ion transporter superfamily protein YfcC